METAKYWFAILADIATASTLLVLLWQFYSYRKRQSQKEIEKLEKELEDLKKEQDRRVQYCQNRYELYAKMDKLIVENPDLKRFISNKNTLQDIENGNIDKEKLKEISFIEMVMNICQLSYYQYSNDDKSTDLSWVKELLQNKYVIDYWKSGYKCRYIDGFEDFVFKEIGIKKV
ncbi:hypothetical protein M2132_000692 [Dysgonomonas sp. PH5-45]|uniref:hypothetical protein n=1 Tax=unclassified Dysgonomonas TaxID=2630389 RepID=UPI0024740417|nr:MULTISPECIES: hypothetical protein [unclassified Dysgonomonas]MDH6354364.1 hypothetical protein [Dysgonomonas sp. PH5-45]MDH6387264.1 hypothetical protein [Dysgonomonas sp. PH5-37]